MEKDKRPVLTLSEYEEKRIREALDTITPESGPYPEDAEAMFALAQDYEKGDGRAWQML
jgi:hypothetical protein